MAHTDPFAYTRIPQESISGSPLTGPGLIYEPNTTTITYGGSDPKDTRIRQLEALVKLLSDYIATYSK
jgi:hypothetical protein